MNYKLTADLENNLALFRQIFKNDNTLVIREIGDSQTFRCAVLFFDGMISSERINESIVQPLMRAFYIIEPEKQEKIDATFLQQRIIACNDVKIEVDFDKLMTSFISGDTIILVDKDDRPLIASTKGFVTRQPAEPENEKILRGPKEGFTEAFMTNLSLIRRKVKNPDLKFSFTSVGSVTNTTVVFCYIEGVADEAILKKLEQCIEGYQLDSALDINYIVENINNQKYSMFPTTGTTERPDIVAAKLLEGRVAVILDGTPVALTAPHIFLECFQSNDDYYISFLLSNFNRLMRFFGFLIAASLPALYIAFINYNPEIMPTPLLISITKAREGMPFPTCLEMLGLLLIFEVLKEAGTRSPSNIGQALSIVGGLVLGQAAVEAKIVSAPVVIVAAFSGIFSLIIPKLKVASLNLKIIYLIVSSCLGIYGYILCFTITVAYLCKLHSFGQDYLSFIIDGKLKKDVFIRFPWFSMKPKKRFIAKDAGEKK